MSTPYSDLPPNAFWRPAVAEAGPHRLAGLWNPKFPIRPEDTIVTAGSCFAQHIGRALAAEGYGWTDFEPAPPNMPASQQPDFGYGVFSFRTGNIYTPSMLLQWLRLAFGEQLDPVETWGHKGRLRDPLRPAIEPDGFSDTEEFSAARDSTYASIRRAVETADLFVFTLGLTEHWIDTQTSLEYALCPGTVAGTFDARRHQFRNASVRETTRNLDAALKFLRARNPNLRVLLTVSPVPLTATASGRHVLTATSYSKSVLRAAAGMAEGTYDWVDYFPSYEIITHPVSRGIYFAPNMRSVEPAGVKAVMGHFFADQNRAFGPSTPPRKRNHVLPDPETDPVRCEEEMLDAFAG